MILLAALALSGGCALDPLPPMPAEAVATEVVAEVATREGAWVLQAGEVRGDADRGVATVVAVDAPGRPPVNVTAQASEWDLRTRTVVFTGEVVLTRGEVTMRCARLEVRYRDAEHLESVSASGGVEVRQGARRAEAGTATLEARTGEIHLRGAPSLRDGPNELRGEHITLLLDDERVRCEGAAGAPCRLVVAGSALP